MLTRGPLHPDQFPLRSEEPAIRAEVQSLTTPLVISPYVIAELDYLVATRLGTDAAVQILEEISGGAYDLASINANDL